MRSRAGLEYAQGVTYTRFEDLPVWNAAAEVFERVERLCTHPGLAGCGDLRNQLLRAALSISNNVAEGFERGTTAELITFLYYARGSAGEVRSMLRIMGRLERFADLKSEMSNLIALAESCSRQARGWADSLQNSEIKGQRHLTDGSRREYERKAAARAFIEKLDQLRARLGASDGENPGVGAEA
jgi:four helix bundle protein